VSKVFITQEGNHNYTEAQEFGEVIFLTSSEFSPIPTSLKNSDIIKEIRKNMSDYIPGIDYIMPSGSPIAIGVTFMIAREKGATVNILKWDNHYRRYNSIIVKID